MNTIQSITAYRKCALFILLVFLSTFGYSQHKKICISIDDLPAVSYGDKDPEINRKITEKLVATFNKYKIPAIGFVNEGKLYDNGVLNAEKVALLKLWIENGYDLGNHTYSHIDYNRVSKKAYFEDIIKGQKITSSLLKAHNKSLKFFRHPYLHRGIEAEKANALTHFLKENQYREAPVTIDNDEYLFAKAYHLAVIDANTKLMQEIGQKYVLYMEAKLLYFEGKSQEVFGRNISHTLLIHANLLNGDYLDELALMFKKNGYEFISQEEALEDDAYSSPISKYTRRGISWIFLWGMSKGMDENMMTDDIEAPAEIVELAR